MYVYVECMSQGQFRNFLKHLNIMQIDIVYFLTCF